MKKLHLTVVAFATVAMFSMTGCYSKAEKGAAIGATSGALIGSAVGGSRGAVAGAAIGGVSGAAIGHNEDKKDRRYRY